MVPVPLITVLVFGFYNDIKHSRMKWVSFCSSLAEVCYQELSLEFNFHYWYSTLQKQVGSFNHRVVTLVADKLKRQWLPRGGRTRSRAAIIADVAFISLWRFP